MSYTAVINVPGYLPVSDDLPEFETVAEGWAYLEHEREQAESDAAEDGIFVASECLERIRACAEALGVNSVFIPDTDGTGTFIGPTPGYTGDHDLGLAYTVMEIEEF